MDKPMSEENLADVDRLSRDHKELADTYHRVLLLIVDRQADQAEKQLDEFAAKLTRHIELEEKIWVPLFHERFGKSKGFDGTLILQEHKVLDKLLGALRFLLHTIAARGKPLDAQQVLTLLEESFRFRGVLHHHHAREDNVMIPALREIAPPG